MRTSPSCLSVCVCVSVSVYKCICVCVLPEGLFSPQFYILTSIFTFLRVTGGELFEDIVAREYYSEADAR